MLQPLNNQASCLSMDALNEKANPESTLLIEILEHREIPHKHTYFFSVKVVSGICSVLSRPLLPSFFFSSLFLKRIKNTKHIWKFETPVTTGLWVYAYLLY